MILGECGALSLLRFNNSLTSQVTVTTSDRRSRQPHREMEGKLYSKQYLQELTWQYQFWQRLGWQELHQYWDSRLSQLSSRTKTIWPQCDCYVGNRSRRSCWHTNGAASTGSSFKWIGRDWRNVSRNYIPRQGYCRSPRVATMVAEWHQWYCRRGTRWELLVHQRNSYGVISRVSQSTTENKCSIFNGLGMVGIAGVSVNENTTSIR